MRVKPEVPHRGPPKRERGGPTRYLLRSMLLSVVIVVAYFFVPMTNLLGFPGLCLLVGLAGLTALMVWQLRSIARSPYPRIRAAGTLATSVPLFFIYFATAYYLMERGSPGTFNEPLSRLDAVYFTVTVFATVGFGDIVALTEPARAVVLLQMIGDLVIVGFVARAFVRALQTGLNRRDPNE